MQNSLTIGGIMNAFDIQSPKFNLNRNSAGQPFQVDMERFFEFSFWIAEELLDLEAEHKPTFEIYQPLSLNSDLRLNKSDRFEPVV